MATDLTDPEFVTREAFVVAGLAHRGPPEDNHRSLWTDLQERVEELAAITIGEDIYGVAYEYDQSGSEFTYVAGVPVEEPDQMAPEVTMVEIPAATYAAFRASIGEVESVIQRLTDEWTNQTGYRRVDGPMFERFEGDVDPSDPEAPSELHVPVEEV